MILTILICVLILICVFVFSRPQNCSYEKFTEQSGCNYTFSSTQFWEPEFAEFLFDNVDISTLSRLPLEDPPGNCSEQKQLEINKIIELQKTPLNDKSVLNTLLERESYEIVKNIDVENNFTKYHYNIINFMEKNLTGLIMSIKNHYNVVRPSFLSDEIKEDLVLPNGNPGHPSYPSGHATQAFFIAYVLIHYMFTHNHPDKHTLKIKYLKRAREIATRREIAGVHYRSDSDFGKVIAKRVFDILKENNIKVYEKTRYISTKEWVKMLS